jgi:hypothetical protein
VKPYRTLGATEPDYRPSLARRMLAELRDLAFDLLQWHASLTTSERFFCWIMINVALSIAVARFSPFGRPDVATQPLAHEREVAAECRDVCARAGLRMVSVRPAVGVQSCECGER